MTRPRRAAPRSSPPLLRVLSRPLARRLARAAAAGLTVVALGAAAVGGTSSISMAGHAPGSHQPPVQQPAVEPVSAHRHAHGTGQVDTTEDDLPAAFDRRAEAVSRDTGRPALDAPSPTTGGRAARLARQRAEVAQERTQAALAARAAQLAKEASDTSRAAKAERAALHRHVFPLHHSRIVATFGDVGVWARYHTGIDFSAPLGTPIHAAAAGVVTHVGPGGGAGSWAGSYVTIQHAGGYQTLYAHMNPAISVSVGQQVEPGQVIGHVGLTGRTFGPHCHFELYPPGVEPGDVYQAIDPMPWLKSSDPTS